LIKPAGRFLKKPEKSEVSLKNPAGFFRLHLPIKTWKNPEFFYLNLKLRDS